LLDDLVSIDLVLALRDRPGDKTWAPTFAGMVEKDRKPSTVWINTETHAICARVERQP
jgi:hypothetical protein